MFSSHHKYLSYLSLLEVKGPAASRVDAGHAGQPSQMFVILVPSAFHCWVMEVALLSRYADVLHGIILWRVWCFLLGQGWCLALPCAKVWIQYCSYGGLVSFCQEYHALHTERSLKSDSMLLLLVPKSNLYGDRNILEYISKTAQTSTRVLY